MANDDSTAAPSFDLERIERARLAGHVAGVDEAGRGPLAGPVVAAAVILDPDRIPEGIDDSKRLDAARRDELFSHIDGMALAIGVGIADVDRIDRMNILQATLWAMTRAIGALSTSPKLVLVDGNCVPKRLDCEARAIVGGDRRCLSIAAASIIAKVTRDRIMVDIARRYPGYGFDRHKGYPTSSHRAAIERLGPTPVHRRSFRTVQLALEGIARGATEADGSAALLHPSRKSARA